MQAILGERRLIEHFADLERRDAFAHLGSGLATRDGLPLGGFALAGADGQWHWADATIEANRVVVQSASVSSPTAVRYAWADHPASATLVNTEGLPAAPFERQIGTP